MKKKALIIATVAGTIEKFNMPNIDLLKRNGYEVHVACNFNNVGSTNKDAPLIFKHELDDSQIKWHQVDFDRNPFKVRSLIIAYRQVSHILKKDFSLVHAHTPVGGVISRIASAKYRKNGLKSIYTAHGFHFYKGAPIVNWIIFYPIEKFLARFTDTLITINEEDYQRAIKRKFKAQKVKRVHGVGVNLNKFTPVSNQKKESLRRIYNYKPHDFLLICVGELNKNKNQLSLIRSISLLKDRIPDIKLLLLGEGPSREQLTTEIRRLGLSSYIQMFGYRDDVETLMSISDLALSASIREGLPVNIIESMATGLPIIASNCRGNRDLIDHGLGGFISDNTPEFFSKYILLFWENSTQYQYMSIHNINQSKKYSVETIMHEYNDIYDVKND